MKNAPQTLILIVLILVFGLNTYYTTLGYVRLTGSIIAPVIAILINLMFVVILLGMRTIANSRRWALVFMYFIISIFSILPSFSSIYSRYVFDEIINKEIVDVRSSLQEINSRSTSEINRNINGDSLRTLVEPLMKSLQGQIRNPTNPGYGRKAKAVVAEIENILQVHLVIPNGAPIELANQLDLQIESYLRLANTGNKDIGKALIKEINDKISRKLSEIEQGLTEGVPNQEMANLLETGTLLYNDLGAKVTGFLGENYKYAPRFNNINRVGEISHMLDLAFIQRFAPQAIILALLLSIMLGWSPIFLVILFFFDLSPKYKNKNNLDNAQSDNVEYLEKVIKLDEILRSPVEQYLFFFKDFVKTAKGVDLQIEIRQTEVGVKIKTLVDETYTIDELSEWLAEYTSFATREDITDIKVPEDAVVKREEIDLLILKLENQVAHLKNSLKIIELENNLLKQNNTYLKQLASDFAKKDNIIHVQNISGGEQQFADRIKNKGAS